MSFVTNFLSPLIQAVVYVILIGAVCYGVYKGIKGLCPDFKWILKYKILKKKYDENKVKYCIDAYDNGMNLIAIKKAMYIAGKSFRETDEMMYIYNQIFKKLEGGKK